MDALVLKVLNHYINSESSDVVKLKGDASSREYYRDKINNLIICHYHSDREGFEHFTQLQKLFVNNDIRSPKVLHAEFPILIQEDLGDICLEMDASAENYSKVIPILMDLQTLPTQFEFKKTESSFDKEKFLWEMNFAVEHLNKLIPVRNSFDLEKDLNAICEFITETPQCPCHRDFHSKNIMIKSDELYVIDFQDARLGPYLYDLVSLIEDPYVDLKTSEKESLKDQFLKLNAVHYDKDFNLLYKATAIQRIFKACGSFASQFNLKKNDSYLSYLRPALLNLTHLLDDTNYSTLDDFVGLNYQLWKLSDTY